MHLLPLPLICAVLSLSHHTSGHILDRSSSPFKSRAHVNPNNGIKARAATNTAGFIGCYVDSSSARVLSSATKTISTLTVPICQSYCAGLGYNYAGVEYSTQCWCANSYSNAIASTSCTYLCAGDSSTYCGGFNRISVYSATTTTTYTSATTTTASASKSALPSASGAISSFLGCYTDSSLLRVLGNSYTSKSSNSIESCRAQCSGYSFFGVEYGSQCFCSNSMTSSVVSSSKCTYSCSGNIDETCGGFNAIQVYSLMTASSTGASPTTTSTAANSSTATSTYIGCYVDSSSSRILSSTYITSSANSLESCRAHCTGYSYFGVEYGSQCFCSRTISSSAVTSTGCTYACTGASGEVCGGFNRMSVWTVGSSITSTSTDFVIVNSTPAVSSNTASITSNKILTSSAAISSSSSTKTTSSNSASKTSISYTPSLSVPSSSATKFVYAHHMVGNTYSYSQADWLSDITLAAQSGITGFALNLGTDSWQAQSVVYAYAAAAQFRSSFKLFYSFDMTVWSCSAITSTIENYILKYSSHSNQMIYNSNVLVSTFSGESCGDSLWSQMKSDMDAKGHSIFFAPAFFSGTSWSGWSSVDMVLNWNSAWTAAGDSTITTATDTAYMAAIGTIQYMPAISPLFFTHYCPDTYNKNWLYQSDAWVFSTRWQQIIAMRNRVNMVELLTWNDYGESSYIGPVHPGANDEDMPLNSINWDTLDHTPLLALNEYYSTAFQTGAYPTITADKFYLQARPHINTAVATADTCPQYPTLGQDGSDGHLAEINDFFALVFSVSPATVTMTSGSQTSTFSIPAGISNLRSPLTAGSGMTVTLVRNGETVIDYTPSYTFASTTTSYNYNYYFFASD